MVIKSGDKGPQVTEVQKLLSLLGYDLIIDGSFGDKSVRSTKAFQKKVGLEADGVVGDQTLQALKASQKRSAKEIKGPAAPTMDAGTLNIIKTKQLGPSQYIKQVFPKTQIFIHYTAGGPSAENVISGWDSDEPQISTAYVIDGNNGAIYEAFNPDYYSFHLGIKGSNGRLDKASVGIEICNWGPITMKDGKYYTYTNKEVPADTIYEVATPYRGYKYFHKPTDAQLASLESLLYYLIDKYKIKVQPSFDASLSEFNQEVIDKVTAGIYYHTSCRKDKTDYPYYQPLIDLLNRVSQKVNQA